MRKIWMSLSCFHILFSMIVFVVCGRSWEWDSGLLFFWLIWPATRVYVCQWIYLVLISLKVKFNGIDWHCRGWSVVCWLPFILMSSAETAFLGARTCEDDLTEQQPRATSGNLSYSCLSCSGYICYFLIIYEINFLELVLARTDQITQKFKSYIEYIKIIYNKYIIKKIKYSQIECICKGNFREITLLIISHIYIYTYDIFLHKWWFYTTWKSVSWVLFLPKSNDLMPVSFCNDIDFYRL